MKQYIFLGENGVINVTINKQEDKKAHPWRVCPIGKHYVRTHLEHISSSKEHPNGLTITRHEHCATNPSHKDLLSIDEIHAIAEKNFASLSGPPAANALSKTDFPKADDYDVLIRGWVCYWNDIFKPAEPLDPNLVKALMATESSFEEKAINERNKIIRNHAHGLLQVLGKTAAILNDHKGELSDYLIDVKVHDLYDPSINICCGIRWLFQKKKLASSRLGHEANWEETIIDYKGYGEDVKKGKIPDPLKRMQEYYALLREAK